jgi:hypothetical protein
MRCLLLGLLLVSARAEAGPLVGGQLVRTSSAALDEGVDAFERGDYGDALPLLRRAYDAGADDDLELLLGITHYRLGRGDLAEPYLERAAHSNDAETADSARVFLGLIASERGEVDRARTLLSAVSNSSSPDLAVSGQMLLGAVMPKPISGGVLVRTEYDSNVPLASLAAAPASNFGDTADADLFVLGTVIARPFQSLGFSIQETASYRKHFQLSDYDLFSNTASLRWDYLGASDRVGLGYAFDAATLGSSMFYTGNGGDAAYRRALYGDFGLALRYSIRQRDYFPAAYEPYTGVSHTGAFEASFGTPERRFEAAVAALAIRELTRDASFVASALGGRGFFRGSFGPCFGSLSYTLLARNFDLVPSDGSPQRSDTQMIGELIVGFETGTFISVLAGATYARNVSNVADYDYRKWTAYLGAEASLP